MVLCLLIGDSHIPYRAKEVSQQILKKLDALTTRQLFDYTFFTGDVINAPNFIKFLRRRTENDFFVVVGNMDYYYGNRDAPLYQEVDILLNSNKLKVGLTHGAQIRPRGDHTQLEQLAIEKGDNILISGHTHKEDVFLTKKGILLINPGSITGAWSFVASGIPTFSVIRIDPQKKDIDVSLYQLNIKNNKISKLDSYFIFENNEIKYKY
jgi:putative phosphoesterase